VGIVRDDEVIVTLGEPTSLYYVNDGGFNALTTEIEIDGALFNINAGDSSYWDIDWGTSGLGLLDMLVSPDSTSIRIRFLNEPSDGTIEFKLLGGGNTEGVETNTVSLEVVTTSDNIIENGDFETGDLTGWDVLYSNSLPRIVGDASNYYLYMSDGNGEIGSGRTTYIAQTVDITDIFQTLSIDYRIIGNDGTYDWMKVYVNNSEIAYWYNDSGGWQTFTYDLSSYVDQTIEIKISAYSRDSIITVQYYVDNISVE